MDLKAASLIQKNRNLQHLADGLIQSNLQLSSLRIKQWKLSLRNGHTPQCFDSTFLTIISDFNLPSNKLLITCSPLTIVDWFIICQLLSDQWYTTSRQLRTFQKKNYQLNFGRFKELLL